jgi:hypothetical protein
MLCFSIHMLTSAPAACHTLPGVLLVGHSMGGVVARAAMRQATTMLELGKPKWLLAITKHLGSPIQAPPVQPCLTGTACLLSFREHIFLTLF